MAVAWNSLEVWSDIAGFVSALALLIPAWRSDWVAKVAADLRRPGQADSHAADTAAAVESGVSGWRRRDRYLLRIGMILLVASFALKLLHHNGWKMAFGT